MIGIFALKPADRILVLAPHPDDESVAAGGLLQHALAVGARTLVVFFSDGDNNPWAQRAYELRWRIGVTDRARFAVRRRAEARSAIERLDLEQSSISFLGFPDQGATDLLMHGNEVAMNALTGVLREWQPTIVVGPSLLDLHPDHSALAVLLSLALDSIPTPLAPRSHLRYLVHNPGLLARHEDSLVLPLSPAQRNRKRAAIACHRTQLVLRSTWLLSFAKREERFYLAESPTGLAEHPVRGAVRDTRTLELVLASRPLLRAAGARTVCLAGGAPPAAFRLAVDVPARDGAAKVRDPRAGEPLGEAEFRGRKGVGSLLLPTELVAGGIRLFAKVERASGFFDEAGWKELQPAQRAGRSET